MKKIAIITLTIIAILFNITMLSANATELTNKSAPIIGDTDLDGKITIKDATELQLHIAKLKDLTSEQLLAADVDHDGLNTIKDVTLIQLYLANLLKNTNIGTPLETDTPNTEPTTATDPTETSHTHTWEPVYATEQHKICHVCGVDITELAKEKNMDDWDYFVNIHMNECSSTAMKINEVTVVTNYKCSECGKMQNSEDSTVPETTKPETEPKTEPTTAPNTKETTVHEHEWEPVGYNEFHIFCPVCGADTTQLARDAGMSQAEYLMEVHSPYNTKTNTIGGCGTYATIGNSVFTTTGYQCWKCGETKSDGTIERTIVDDTTYRNNNKYKYTVITIKNDGTITVYEYFRPNNSLERENETTSVYNKYEDVPSPYSTYIIDII